MNKSPTHHCLSKNNVVAIYSLYAVKLRLCSCTAKYLYETLNYKDRQCLRILEDSINTCTPEYEVHVAERNE
jgi:hypothetical protein